MSTELPFYKRFPKDYLADENVAVMTLEEEGAYNRLLDYCWLEGSIPDDITRLARLCRTSEEKMAKLWPGVRPCFREGENGRMVHPRLDKERMSALTKREKLSEAGRRGRRKQLQEKEPGATPGPPPGKDPQATPGHSQKAEPDTEEETTSRVMSSENGGPPKPGDLEKDGGRYVYPDAFEDAWGSYPDREGPNSKKAAYRAWRARVHDGEPVAKLSAAVRHYREHCDAERKTGGRYVLMASTFFGPDDHWKEWAEKPTQPRRVRHDPTRSTRMLVQPTQGTGP